jgi:hypothetical protein
MTLSFSFVFAPVPLTQNVSSLAQAADMARRKQAERLALEKLGTSRKPSRRKPSGRRHLVGLN